MLSRSLLALVPFIALLSLSGDLARASTQRALKLATMVEKSDFIFVGTAVQSESAWNAEHTRIYTRTTFEVEEYVKGQGTDQETDGGGAVVVETLGGVVGDVGMMVPGVPQFRQGEKNLLFISTGPRTGKHRVVGWSQGRFKIKKDPKTGREMLSRPMAGVSLLNQIDPNLKSIRYLDEMKEAIRQAGVK